MKEKNKFFQKLLNYHHHYNQLFIAHCKRHQDKITPRTLELLNHSVAAQVIWNQRIIGDTNYDPQLWTNRDLSKIEKWEQAHFKLSEKIILEHELDELIHFNSSQGEAHTRSLEHIMFHALNHYTYHRGQITLEFRTAGLDPIPSDYILFGDI